MSRKFREKAERGLSYVRFSTLRLNWIEERGDSRLSAQPQEHQPKVIREDKMRHSEQNAGQAAPTQIGQDRFRGLAESKRRVFHVRALEKAAGEEHERHQADAIGGCPEMQFDQ